MSFAKVVLSGLLTTDPEKRFTPNNHAVASFTLQVENTGAPGRQGNNEPYLVKVTCWRNLAEAVTTQLTKGDNVLVEGKLMMNSFQAQDGTQKKVFEIDANTIDKLPGRPEAIIPVAGEGGANAQQGGSYGVDAGNRTATPAYEASYNNASGPSAPGNAVPGGSGHFSSEDLLTEDDIPF